MSERSMVSRPIGWSWRAGRLWGVEVYAHVTFLLLFILVGLSHWREDQTIDGAVAGLGFIVALLACVLSHECGHVLTARWYGIPTRDVTLLPIGGVAGLYRAPSELGQEIVMASAGPLVSLVIAGDLYLWVWFTGHLQSVSQLTVTSGPFFERLMIANIALAAFNLIPAIPMDGGRVLRVFLAKRRPRLRATELAAIIGKGTACFIGVIGLFSSPMLVLIAWGIWVGAAHEISTARADTAGDELATRDR